MPGEAPPSAPGGAPGGDAVTGGGKRSRWMTHVKKTMRANKGKSLSQVLKMAKKTYKKTGGGETEAMAGGALQPMPLDGGRRRSRKGSRKGSKGKKGSRKH